MKAYVITTGAVFGLLTVAHVVRMFLERPRLGDEPWYIVITLASAALCAWAVVVLRRLKA
jgi:hypothetical protein